MNGNSILLDTNIVLYLLNGDKTLIPLLENKRLFVSFITEIELLSYKGIKDKDQAILKEFLSECLIVDINQLIKENTVEIRKKYSLKLPDCIIDTCHSLLVTNLCSSLVTSYSSLVTI